MDKVIRDGTLRVLISESTCDVILSCKDHRLMAHKLILSIASPVFRELLRKSSNDSTTVIILPDINASTMSTILDYIYTGTSVVYSNYLKEFLSVASFLEIAVDTGNMENVMENLHKVEDIKKLETECNSKKRLMGPTFSAGERVSLENVKYSKKDVKNQDVECVDVRKEVLDDLSEPSLEVTHNSKLNIFQRSTQKKLPELLPISSKIFRKNVQRKMCNAVVPSPWCQRNDRSFLGDPRAVTLGSSEEVQKLHTEDTNNNFQLFQNSDTPKGFPKSLDSIIRHLYLNNLDNSKERTKTNTTLGEDYSTKSDVVVQSSEICQIDIDKAVELPNVKSFSFSRSLVALKLLENKTQSETSDCINNLSTKCSDKHLRSFLGNSSSELVKNNVSQSDFAQNLSLSRKSTCLPQTSPPSGTLTQDPPTILKTSLTSPNYFYETSRTNTKKKLTPSTCIELNSNSNDNSSFNDVSNNNSLSNDSSGDEKKQDEANAKKKSYKCEDCGKSFSQLRNYKYHRSIHEGTKEFSTKCPECGKMFNDRGYLSSHMKIHRDRKEYACPNCPKRFNQRVAYNMHLRIHTGIKPHECPTCGKSFSRKMLLKQHQRVHTGERPYTCPECFKTFADRSNMSLHARLHTGIKPYGCTLCPKSFTKKHHLKTHMNFHTGLKPYTCDHCGLAFSQSSNMRTHYKKCVLKDGIGKNTKSESVSSAENNNSS